MSATMTMPHNPDSTVPRVITPPCESPHGTIHGDGAEHKHREHRGDIMVNAGIIARSTVNSDAVNNVHSDASNHADNHVNKNANNNVDTTQGDDEPWTIGQYVAWVLSSIVLIVMLLTGLRAYANRLESARVSGEQAQYHLEAARLSGERARAEASEYMNDNGILSMRDDPCISIKCDNYARAFNDDNDASIASYTIIYLDHDAIAHRGVLVTMDGEVSIQELTD